MTKEKIQGTNFENWTAAEFVNRGHASRRLPEGGSKDEGDLEVFLNGERSIIECKARQQLSIQLTLSKARKKAAGLPVIIFWKRIVKTEGKVTRQPVGGERVVVAMSSEDFFRVLNNAYEKGLKDGTEGRE